MIETTPEGFKILKGAEGIDFLMIDSERINECIDYAKNRGLTYLGINSFLGFTDNNISFLEEISDFVKGLTIPERHFDLSVLNDLHKLEFLGFADDKKSEIDLSNFPELETLACEYTKRLRSLESCEQLRQLSMSGYKSSRKTIEDLPVLSSLQILSLFVTNIESLEGIQRFPILNRLSIFRATKLSNIDALAVNLGLKVIEFDTCKKIEDYDVLGRLDNLRRLLIANSAPVQSLAFVKNLDNLEFLSFVGTNVSDGDISPAIGISYVGFDDKPHYSHTFKEVLNAVK